MPILSWCLFDADCPHANVLPTLHSGLGLLAMGKLFFNTAGFVLLSVTGMWCWKTRALPVTFATFCDCTFSGEVLQEVVIFAIATLCNLRADFVTHFFLHTLVSYCAMHDTNLWRPLTIAIFGSFDQACILTAHAWLERCLNGNKKQSMHQLIWLGDSSLSSTTPG